MHNPITHELAELLSEDLLRDTRHDPPKSRKVPRRFRQPVHDDQFPFTADRRQRSRQRAPTNRIGTRWVNTVTCNCLLDGDHRSDSIPSQRGYRFDYSPVPCSLTMILQVTTY